VADALEKTLSELNEQVRQLTADLDDARAQAVVAGQQAEAERARANAAEQQLRERDADFDRVASVGRKALERAEAAERDRAELRNEAKRKTALLTLYRVKLSTDGLNGRTWHASPHLEAVQALAEAGEEALRIDSYQSLVILRDMVGCALDILRAAPAPAPAEGGPRG
jgi:chromosome segregation ATPase